MPMSPRTLRPRASGVHPDAAAWRSTVVANGGSVSATTMRAVDAFCRSIDQAGIRSKFRRLNLMCGNSDASLVAVRTPLYRGESRTGTQYGNALDTNVNFVQGDYAETGANGGLLGDGTSKYLDTGFNVSSLPGAANCHLAGYIRGTQSVSGADTIIGTLFNGTADRYRIFLLENNASTYLAFTELGKTANANTSRANANGGLIVSSRVSTTSLALYDDAASIATNTTSVAEDASGSVPFFVFARNGPTEYFPNRIAGYSIGAGLTGAEVTSYYNALDTFQKALSRNQA